MDYAMAGGQTLIYYINAYTTLISAVLGVCFSVGAIMAAKDTSRTNALYMFARSLSLACVAAIPVCRNAPDIEADPHSVQILESVLSSCGYPYVKGKTWTSDAIYRETLPLIQERRQEGCLVVEMECASMLAVSKYRHIPFIQFLYGADNLSSDTWEIRDLNLYGLNSAEKYMVLAFECGLAM